MCNENPNVGPRVNKSPKAEIFSLLGCAFSELKTLETTVPLLAFLSQVNYFKNVYIYMQVSDYLESNKFLNDFQFGFRSGKNTSQAIFNFLAFIAILTIAWTL